MIVQEAKGVVRRAKAARKNIPNVFFDYLLPREKLSVVRVVGALLFYSIQWGPGGERRVPVRLSITELSRLTKLSRQHVHEAVMEARQHGYIEQVEAGFFDPKAGEGSRAATYGIRWTKAGPATASASPAAPDSGPAGVTDSGQGRGQEGPRQEVEQSSISDRSEKVNGAPVGKGERDQSKKVNGERSEKVNGIRIKTDLKNNLTTAEEPSSNAVGHRHPDLTAVAASYQVLVETGFAEACARRLATNYPLEAIQRQIEWLPLRNTARNRLGLLRCAIEQDWPKPEAGGDSETQEKGWRLGKVFASHYYAAYHGNSGAPITEPFAKEVKMAANFVERLSALNGDEESVPEWGRRFGALLRQKHRGDAKAKPNLSFALVLYGDELLTVLEKDLRTRQSAALGQAREFHRATFEAAYRQYLRGLEAVFQKDYALQYACFTQQRGCTRRALTGGLLLASADTLARFDGEESRLEGFAEFFKDHPQRPVLSFWQWDAQLNPQRFRESRPAAPSQRANG